MLITIYFVFSINLKNCKYYCVEFGSTTITFGDSADIIRPIGTAAASNLSAECHNMLKNSKKVLHLTHEM